MRITETRIAGVYVIDVEPVEDERGFFARTWCAEELRAKGLCDTLSQASYSQNKRRGTLRGMHYQRDPHGEHKLVSCTRGRILDVALDLRASSPTYCQWVAEELTDHNYRSLYIPPGCAHGMVTLEDDTVVAYKITPAYVASHAAGVRWNDPAFNIAWPVTDPILSPRDRALPDFVR